MMSKDPDTAVRVANRMKAVYESIGLAHHTYITTINNRGVKMIEE